MNDVIVKFFSVIQTYIQHLFSLEIVSGVSFGGFIVSVAIFGIVVSFFWSNIIGGR